MAAKKAPAKKQPKKKGKAVTHADVRMYRIGTGDCFAIKFFSGKTNTFTMMIDCGAWQGSKAVFTEHVTNLKEYVGNRVDVLVVTHEHKDHVLGFELCEDLFTTDFEIGKTWMAWAEEDGDDLVEEWKKDIGKKKIALAAAAQKLSQAVGDAGFQTEVMSLHRGWEALQAHQRFSDVVGEFTGLQMALDHGAYAGPLAGMKSVKKTIALGKDGKPNIKYFRPRDIIENVPGLEGVRIYVLGPPLDKEAVRMEDSGAEGETYQHNKELAKSNAFSRAVSALAAGGSATGVLPFDEKFEGGKDDPVKLAYEGDGSPWRRIDHDWLLSAGSLALRLNTGLNNLSLALAIEFVESGRVMLFPGDAEYGSWASWHDIEWEEKGRGKNPDGSFKHLTEDLLNRTVFYKVAHHLSHNGTARRKGLDMMTDHDLAAMATLDYGVISSSWTGTMPNQGLLEDLLTKTRGRLMIMRTDKLFFDARKKVRLEPKIEKARAEMSPAELAAFTKAHKPPEKSDLFIEFRVKA